MYIRSFSHEIRHPITSIISIAELSQNLLEEIPFKSDLEQNFKLIKNDAEQLLCVSNLIRDTTDIYDECFQLQLSDVNVKDFLNEMIESIQIQATRAGINLQVEVKESVPADLSFDKKRAHGILLNFLSNALKYTKKGFIKLSAKISKNKLSREQLSFGQLLCKFKVQDTGCGMDNQQQDNLFKMFGASQQRSFNLQKPKGIGLRLFLSQQIALQMSNIPIKVKSSLGIGSSFSVYIIVNQINKMITKDYEYLDSGLIQNELHRKDSLVPLSPSQITCDCSQFLLVDDSEIIRMVLANFFNKFSYIEARDGKEAYKAVKQKLTNTCCSQFLMIIMDCEMPNMDGFEATRRIRQLGYNGIIIGHTAFCNYSDIERCYNAGMNEVLNKPSYYQDFINAYQKNIKSNLNRSLIRNGSFSASEQIKQRAHSSSKKNFGIAQKFSPQSTMLQIYKITQESPRVSIESKASSKELKFNLSFYDFESESD